MATRELGKLERVLVTEIWPHEERNFTKWMEDNLGHLDSKVGMELQFITREYRTEDGGRVDILAEDKKTGGRVVIENQVYWSDNDHLLRMIGYAASTKAKSIIWVASGFHEAHIRKIEWLTEAGANIFCVKIGAVKIGEMYAPQFEVVVSPEQAADRDDGNSDDGTNIYARFYRPLTADLRTEGIYTIGGRQGGWTGRYRRYRCGAILEGSEASLFTTFGWNGEQCQVGLRLAGGDQAGTYDALYDDRDCLTNALGHLDWQRDERTSDVWAERDPVADEKEGTLQDTRDWMIGALRNFKAEFQPRLEEIRRNLVQ